MEPDVNIISPGLFGSGVFPDENAMLRGLINGLLTNPPTDTTTYSSSMPVAGETELARFKYSAEQTVADAFETRKTWLSSSLVI